MTATTSPKPRILILSTAYLPLIGGSELAIHHIARRLTGYDFDLVTGRHTPDQPLMEQIGRVRVFRAGGRLARLTFLLPKNFMPLAMAATAVRLMHKHRYVCMHAYQASQAAGAACLAKFLHPRMPFILTIQEGKDLDKQPRLMRFFRALIFRSANRITAISAYLAAYARRYSRVDIDIIPNGVDFAEVARPPSNPDPTILTVSRLVPKNNVEGIVRALPLVRNSITNARLAIVGDGPLRSHLEALSTQLGVRDLVHFMGTVSHDELSAVYAMADVFVRPSLSEGLGSAFLEAMAAGVPVVASDVGGIPDIVKDGQTGLLCNPNDPSDIAKAIVRMLVDRPLRENIVRNAEVMVREKYDWAIISEKMASVYNLYA